MLSLSDVQTHALQAIGLEHLEALNGGYHQCFLAAAVLVSTAAALCALGAVVALAVLPRRRREPRAAGFEALALSFARCPGAPYCGHLARLIAFGRRVRGSPAPP